MASHLEENVNNFTGLNSLDPRKVFFSSESDQGLVSN